MKKYFHLLAFFCFYFTCLNGQDVSLQNLIPPSPEAAAFAKYGTYPVSYYTGKPDITIPVYEIKTKNFSIPISLNYDASGIRVDDIAGWAGMNWSLNGLGVISRMVVRNPDEESDGFLQITTPRQSEIQNNQYYLDYMKSAAEGNNSGIGPVDPDPDRFYYSLPNKGGSFVFDRNGNIIVIPESSIKISFSNTNPNPSFRIIDENGTTYIFAGIERTQVFTISEATSNIRNVRSAWHLTEMISHDQTEHIYFTYESESSGTQKTNNFTETYGDKMLSNSGPQPNVHERFWTGMERTMQSQRIKTITFSTGKIEFSRVVDRQDDIGSRLSEIITYRKDGAGNYIQIQSFQLIHSYYYSSDDYTTGIFPISQFPPSSRDRYRLRLDETKIRDGNNTVISGYKFYYNNSMLPPKTSCQQDWWGYYNGPASPSSGLRNTNLVPRVTVNSTQIGGADRTPSETHMRSGILEKIEYPTGGYSLFETEAHRYIRSTTIEEETHSATAQGKDVAGLIHQKTISFTVPAGIQNPAKITVTIAPYNTSGNPSYSNSADQVNSFTMPYAKIKNMSSGQETVFQSNNNATYYSTVVNNFNLQPNITYEITAWCYANQDGAFVAMTVSFNKTVNVPTQVIVGGLRIKSIKNYNSDNTFAGEETYMYGENEDGGGTYAGIPSFANYYSRAQKSTIATGGTPACTMYNGIKGVYLSSLIFDQTLIQGSPVVYRYVTRYLGNPGNNAGKTIYDYGQSQSAPTTPLPIGSSLANNMGILIINDAWKKGHLILQQDFRRNQNGTYSLVKDITNTWTIQNTGASYGLLAALKFDKYYFCPFLGMYNFDDYAYAEYPINTGFVQLAQTVEKEYLPDASNIVTTTTQNTYDNIHTDFIVASAVTNSKNENIVTNSKYPFNKSQIEATGTLSPAESETIDLMIERNIILPVIEVTVAKNGNQISRIRSMYKFNSPSKEIISPAFILVQKGNNAIEARILFNKYDNFGNLIEQQKTTDIVHSYLFDYFGVYPVAEVINANNNEIAFTSFEADGTGNWTIGSAARITGTAATGNRYYQIVDVPSAISKSGLFPSREYILSYWTKNSVPFSIAGTQGSPIAGKQLGDWKCFTHRITGVSVVNISQNGYIDAIRLHPKEAAMKTFTYDPLLGISSICDTNNTINFYEYDALGRLKLIRDQNKNILKTFTYKYQEPQQ